MEMVRATRQQGVPVIKVDDEYIVGFDQRRLEQLFKGGQPSSGGRVRFGAAVGDLSAAPASASDWLPATGVYVGAVHPDSVAARAGLVPGDVIVELNGEPVPTVAALQARLGRLTQGAHVLVGYVREGERRTAEAQL
jgi:serine protease Do